MILAGFRILQYFLLYVCITLGHKFNIIYQYCPEDDFCKSANALQGLRLGVVLAFFDLKLERLKRVFGSGRSRVGAQW
jgi:hypothetical protein